MPWHPTDSLPFRDGKSVSRASWYVCGCSMTLSASLRCAPAFPKRESARAGLTSQRSVREPAGVDVRCGYALVPICDDPAKVSRRAIEKDDDV